ncbi:MAG: tetraacyldisaccharide 4'-kinase [Fimbriimonadaceae bacterium]|nr:tetraacyldisaccharide 4'-kinase [Fimbriimonadaceae bacterium]
MAGRIEEHWDHLGIAAMAMAPLGLLYGLGWRAYRTVYDLGLKKAKRPHRPVVCIGSLLAGGAGKTPVTIHVADVLARLGRSVVVGISGYRSWRREGAHLAPAGPLDPVEWGDETALMRRLRPDLDLIVGRDRVEAARICAAERSEAVLLMDDGFQHLPIHLDVSILLDPPNLSNRLPIPAGGYREPWKSGRARADLVLPGEDFAPVYRIPGLIRADGGPAELPAKAASLCAIGRPERFFTTLSDLGVELQEIISRPDHDPLDEADLLRMLPKDRTIVTTMKDWMKLERRADIRDRDVRIVQIEAVIEPQAEFARWLDVRLQEAR